MKSQIILKMLLKTEILKHRFLNKTPRDKNGNFKKRSLKISLHKGRKSSGQTSRYYSAAWRAAIIF